MSVVRVGVVILPTERWADARATWRLADELGFETAWTYDHLTWRDLRDGPWFAAMPVLTAAAGVTARIRLGTLVTSPNFRHPVTLAKEAMTLDDVSGGRLTLGIGAGGTGFDATALGQEAIGSRARADRFAEFVEHLDTLLTTPATDRLDGRVFSAVDARSLPGCLQRLRVPFAIAATGERGMGLAVRHAATWVTYGDVSAADGADVAHSLSAVGRQVARLEERCAAAGRDPGTIRRLYLSGIADEPWLESAEACRELAGRYAECGITDVAIHWPREEPPFRAPHSSIEAIAEILEAGAIRG